VILIKFGSAYQLTSVNLYTVGYMSVGPNHLIHLLWKSSTLLSR